MAKRHVFDDSNPFAPELKQSKIKPSTSSDIGHHQKPPVQRLKMRFQGMDVYSRHKQLINNYVLYHKGSTSKLQRDSSNDKNDHDIIREHHRFLWEDTGDGERTWEAQLAKKYYDKLFKEYCIADLSQYKQNRIAMRWRVEKEVFSGKGQFECGSKHCTRRDDLSTWEVNFTYKEHGERKNALVKLRLCPECSEKLNFHSKKRLIKKQKKLMKKEESAELSTKKRKHKQGREHRHRSHSRSTSSSEAETAKETVNVKTESTDITEQGMEKKDEKQVTKEAAEIWSRKAAVLETEKTAEDELDEFLDDLFL